MDDLGGATGRDNTVRALARTQFLRRHPKLFERVQDAAREASASSALELQLPLAQQLYIEEEFIDRAIVKLVPWLDAAEARNADRLKEAEIRAESRNWLWFWAGVAVSVAAAVLVTGLVLVLH